MLIVNCPKLPRPAARRHNSLSYRQVGWIVPEGAVRVMESSGSPNSISGQIKVAKEWR